MKVYLLTDGDYSDYHIVGAFSTEERAESIKIEYIKGYTAGSVSIEEIELDVMSEQRHGLIYTSQIILDTGELNINVMSRKEVLRNSYEQLRDPNKCIKQHCSAKLKGKDIEYLRVFSPISFEHADKVAIEEYQKYLRNGFYEAGCESD